MDFLNCTFIEIGVKRFFSCSLIISVVYPFVLSSLNLLPLP